jgi:uncharacterized damage-inducible protein DinB
MSSCGWIGKIEEFFNRSTRTLTEADSTFAPAPGMFTVAQQVAHVAQTIDWFSDAAFKGKGFSMDFAAHDKVVRQFTSLAKARAELAAAFDRMRKLADATPAEQMSKPVIPPGTVIMPGATPIMILSAAEDHTAHHRGALTVYARLRGHVPPMPYMDM